GTRGTGPLQFNTPHAISVDAKGMVYVADRGNSRIQVLDNDLNLKSIYDNVGAPWAVCISNGPHQYLYSSNSFPTGNNFDQAPTPHSSHSRRERSRSTRMPTRSRFPPTRFWEKSPAWRRTREGTSSCTRGPATPSRRSATSAPFITTVRVSFSSIRTASS